MEKSVAAKEMYDHTTGVAIVTFEEQSTNEFVLEMNNVSWMTRLYLKMTKCFFSEE